MRVVIHLSDLHFGRVDAATVEPLVKFIANRGADLVVISGDLTQRARSVQFAEARTFLDRITAPLVVVPGNHDIPLNPVGRFARPLAKFRRHITPDLAPFFADAEMAVAGLNTARSLTTKYGRINPLQLRRALLRFAEQPESVMRIMVTHHPFDLPADYRERRQLVGRAQTAMTALAAHRVDLLLSGHLHLAHASLTAMRYPTANYSALVVLAGTATSTRGRGETNSFNVLQIARDRLVIERVLWDPDRGSFNASASFSYRRGPHGLEKIG